MDTQKLRQRILDLAIRGKLVPQDPNDEPASVLLDRIRAEKERLIAEGKIKRPPPSCLRGKLLINPDSFPILPDVIIIVILVIFHLYLAVRHKACEQRKGIQVGVHGQMPPALIRA